MIEPTTHFYNDTKRRLDSMKYKIKSTQLWIPKYGICPGAVGVDTETVCLSGLRLQRLFAVMIFPCAFALNGIAGVLLGFNLKVIPLIILCSVMFLIVYYRWKSFLDAPISVNKRLITNVERDRKNISFCLPNPEGMDKQSVKVSLKARNEDEAIKLENELRS
jgi:hypothetical protein